MKEANNRQPRGIRNCNPLNIRRTSDLWQGLAEQQTDDRFFQFRSMAWGYRAAFIVIRTYHTKMGQLCVENLIKRWAPDDDDNDTEIYIRQVCTLTGLHRHELIDISRKPTMVALVAAMSRVENGKRANLSQVLEGWRLYMG